VFGFVADVHFEAALAGGDREPLITELTDDVKRLSRRLFEREPELVRRDRALDLGAHVSRCFEEAIGWHEAIECLMRTLEVVVADEMIEPVLRVLHVREDRAAEKLVPQRSPEALDLAKRLRMLRSAPDMLHAEPREELLEFSPPTPHRVLPAVVRQHFSGIAVGRNAPLEGLHHERRLLVMRERVSHDEAAVVVHEHAHVQPLRPPQPKREDVRLPQLIRRRAFEAPRSVFAFDRWRRGFDQSLLVQDPPDLLLAYADRLEPGEHVADPPCPPHLVLALELHDLLAHWRCLRSSRCSAAHLPALGLQR